ncbi:DUF4845 domain-containing protein [Ideonella margarita]|uniref:DUF4845 domain-containing protein n=1 Tax=Ideonella margarita TaxID=2984191 RepID=A0ABU9BZP4_9BURK
MIVRSPAHHAQRGLSMFGLLFTAVAVAFAALMIMRIFPTVNEYLTVQKSIDKIMAENPSSVPEIRRAFDRQRDVEYAITTLNGSDLEIEAVGDKFRVRFAYEKEVDLFPPVYLLIKYRGGSR